MKPYITPGKAGTVELSDLASIKMTTGGEKTITRAIVDGNLVCWVGIGWVTEREATQADADAYPVAVPLLLAEGAILYGTWGYEQTNADFYRVIALAGQWATLQRLTTCPAWAGDSMAGTAVPGEPCGEPFRRKVMHSGRPGVMQCRINAYGPYVQPWDGKPVRVTCYA